MRKQQIAISLIAKRMIFHPILNRAKKVNDLLVELTDKYPQIDDWPEDDIDECPWSIAFDVSEGHILMPMVFFKS